MFRKRNTAGLMVLLMICAMVLSACGSKPAETPDVMPVQANVREYVNTVEAFGNTTHSSVRIGDDGRFVMRDNYSAGTNEITGTWSLSENVYTLKVESSTIGNYQTIKFEVKDEQTIILKTSLTGSKAEQTFSADPNAEMISLDSKDDFPYGTYHNISSTGALRSYIVIYPKGTYSYVDTDGVTSDVISGQYTAGDDRLSCTYVSDGKEKTFDLQIRNDGILVLLNDLGASGTGNLFSMDKDVTDPNVRIPCEGIIILNHKAYVNDDDPGWNIEAVPYPENSTDAMYFFSGDPSILEIDQEGNVTVHKSGDTYIRIVCGEKENTVYVSVRKTGPVEVLFDPGAEAIDLGTGIQLKAIVIGGTGNEKVTYSSDDPSIASVSSGGYVTGLMPGKTRINASLPNGLTGYCNVYVNGEMVTIKCDDVTLKAGESCGLPIKAYLITNHDNWYNKADIWYELEFETDDPSVLSYSQSILIASPSVKQEMTVSFWFTWTDGSSLSKTSPVYKAHIIP